MSNSHIRCSDNFRGLSMCLPLGEWRRTLLIISQHRLREYGFVPTGNKSLLEQMLTQHYVASPAYSELTAMYQVLLLINLIEIVLIMFLLSRNKPIFIFLDNILRHWIRWRWLKKIGGRQNFLRSIHTIDAMPADVLEMYEARAPSDMILR